MNIDPIQLSEAVIRERDAKANAILQEWVVIRDQAHAKREELNRNRRELASLNRAAAEKFRKAHEARMGYVQKGRG